MRTLEFLLASAAIEITPGPNMSFLAALAMARGAGPAVKAVLGVATGLLIVGGLASLGLTDLLAQWPAVGLALRWAGVAYMLWLALDAWRAVEEPEEASAFGSYWKGLTTNLLNPKLMVFYAAMMPGFVDRSAGQLLQQNLTLVAIYTAVATTIHLCIIFAASRVQVWMSGAENRRRLGRVSAVLLVGVAVWMAAEAGR